MAYDANFSESATFNATFAGNAIDAVSNEVIDIRTAYDGTVYPSAGDAVRNQIINANKLYVQKTVDLELGNISMSANGWGYTNSTTRVRTVKDETIQLSQGDIIKLTDYSNARFYVGWKKADGTYGLAGWLTADYTVTDDGKYVILLCNRADTAQTDETALGGLLQVWHSYANDMENMLETVNTVTKIQEDVNANVISVVSHAGFLDSSGNVRAATSVTEVYTDLIPVYPNQKINVKLEYEKSQNMWLCFCIYDEDGNCKGRINLVDNNTQASYSGTITIPDEIFFIAFTFRTFSNYGWFSFGAKYNQNDTTGIRNLFNISEANRNEHVSMINQNINSVNHRGYNFIAPENTIPAYKLSKMYGFSMVETDISFTSDDVAVLLHDDTINRTARNADGSSISQTINIADITYAEALTYDFGIWKDAEYADTKIPTFEEFILLCKNLGLHPYIELKSGTQGQIESLIDIVNAYGMTNKVTWISFIVTLLTYVKNYDSKARIGLVTGAVTTELINYALALKTTDNEVFIDNRTATSEEIAACKTAGLPLEVWTYDTVADITGLDPYVSGVTSDNLIAGYELYKANIE